jgi:hypothetical protein
MHACTKSNKKDRKTVQELTKLNSLKLSISIAG